MKPELAIYDDPDADAEAAADAEGQRDLAEGRVISDAAMKAWLLSWGADDELAPPEIGS